MSLWNRLQSPLVLVAALACMINTANAQVITTNGGFEAGFAGWTRVDQLGSDVTFFIQSGTTSPVNGTTVPAPPGGVQAAMSDAQGSGTHVLYQDVIVPSAPFGSAQLQFDVFIGNRASAFFTPSPALLDFSTPVLNQQARVDLLTGSANPFTVTPGDIIQNAFQTLPGNPLVSGYTTMTIDVTAALSANLGNTVRLRFAEVDNVFTFQMGIDNVSITLTPVPEPSSLAMMAIGLAGGSRWIWRRRKVIST
jgi:hypothetical protein